MEILQSMIGWVFEFLNLTITIPINWSGTEKFSFPLYIVFIVVFVIEMIKVLWDGMIHPSSD